MQIPIVVQGEGFVVVAKPPRLLVHRNAANPRAPALLQEVRDMLGTRVWPVHRIDHSASGCVILATDRALAGPLHKALTSGECTKTYWCLVRGQAEPGASVVVRTPLKAGEGQKEAETLVEVLGSAAEPRCSLLRARPRTGRFHQVRRHVRDLSHPIIGDNEHGDSRVNRWWRETLGVTRLSLHCASIEMPFESGRIEAFAPAWPDLRAVWEGLPFWEEATARDPGLLTAWPEGEAPLA